MPIYEYACDTCQSTFERKQKFSDAPVRECPECGSAVRRVLYPAGIIFKGSGFYVTDNRSSGAASTAPSSAASNGGSSNGNESKADSKSDAAPAKTSSAAAADS